MEDVKLMKDIEVWNTISYKETGINCPNCRKYVKYQYVPKQQYHKGTHFPTRMPCHYCGKSILLERPYEIEK